jgi:hypothetical protein
MQLKATASLTPPARTKPLRRGEGPALSPATAGRGRIFSNAGIGPRFSDCSQRGKGQFPAHEPMVRSAGFSLFESVFDMPAGSDSPRHGGTALQTVQGFIARNFVSGNSLPGERVRVRASHITNCMVTDRSEGQNPRSDPLRRRGSAARKRPKPEIRRISRLTNCSAFRASELPFTNLNEAQRSANTPAPRIQNLGISSHSGSRSGSSRAICLIFSRSPALSARRSQARASSSCCIWQA